MAKSGLVALNIPIGSKILHNETVYEFKLVTEKGYMFVDDEGKRFHKTLMYPIKHRLPTLSFIMSMLMEVKITDCLQSYHIAVKHKLQK